MLANVPLPQIWGAKEELLKALAGFGRSSEELEGLAKKMPEDKQLDLDGWKTLASGEDPVWKDRAMSEAAIRRLSSGHAFGGWSNWLGEQVDAFLSRRLNKVEIANALHCLGSSDHVIR